METLVHFSRYAIIQASSRENDPERFVIIYSDENCLRDPIASQSIVEFGFQSREEATSKVSSRMPAPGASKEKYRPNLMSYERKEEGHATSTPGFIKNLGNTFRILQFALATLTILFYSRNLFSIILRSALGFPS